MTKKLVDAIQVIVDFLAERAHTHTEARNFEGTAERVARMYQEVSWPDHRVASELASELSKTFPVDYSAEAGMVVQGPISINSFCPHHLLPFRANVYVGYLPSADNEVLGLSKLARIPDILSKRFVLQEQLAKDIADAFFDPAELSVLKSASIKPTFKSEGSIAMVIGVHSCESCRGIRQDARTLVTERRGAFREETIEARFMQAVSIVRVERPFGG